MLCLDGCGAPAKVRGLAPYCYQKANKRVVARETSWKKLIDAGLALRATKKGWKHEPWFVPRVRKAANEDQNRILGQADTD